MLNKFQRKQQRKQRRLENRKLHQRSDAVAEDEMSRRSGSLGDLNESERTVIATLTTEQPVPMYDRINGRGVVDEILLSSGGTFPDQIVMLDDHSRWSSHSVYGSIRTITQSGDRWRGTLHFARNAGKQIDEIWELVRQKHVTDVSLGYRYGVDDFVDIPSGRTEVVAGRSFTAGARTLRVVTSWRAHEGSLTPVGADDQAKIGRNKRGTDVDEPYTGDVTPNQGSVQDSRQRSNGQTMKKFLKFLHARGLAETVVDQTEALAWASRNLAGDLLSEFAELCRSESVEFTPPAAAGTPTTPPAATPPAQRSDSGIPPAGNPPAATPPAATPPAPQTADQIRAERERIEYIRQMSDGVKAEVSQRAIQEGWDTTRINREFSEGDNRQGRSTPLAPAIHTSNNQVSLRSLQAAMLLRSGIGIEDNMLRSDEASHLMSSRSLFDGAGSDAGWMTSYSRSLQRGGATQDDEGARAVEQAYSLRNASLVDICRASLELEGKLFSSYDTEDIVKRAFSTATLNAVFTTNFGAQMLAGFMGVDDTTSSWTANSDLPNFQTVERFQKHKLSGLKRTDRNQTPEDATVEAVLESYKLHRYSERFTVDEMDIIDDRFGALDGTPAEMGEAAREIRADLVYSILLGNPTMGQDTTALFHTDHGNLTSSGATLSSSTLAARKTAMATQTSNGRLCNIRARHLIVPESKEHIADVLVGSVVRRDATATADGLGDKNWAHGKYGVVGEPRLDVGVTDPSTGTVHAGQPGSWFVAADKGKYGIEVGHLRGTGRAPVVRSYQLTEGRIGRGWLVVMYNAAKAVGYQGLGKSAQ